MAWRHHGENCQGDNGVTVYPTGATDTPGGRVLVFKHLNLLGRGDGSAKNVLAWPSKRMDRVRFTRIHFKKPDVVVQACNLSVGKSSQADF